MLADSPSNCNNGTARAVFFPPLSHHLPIEADRCIVVRNFAFCRRCTSIYPSAALAVSLTLLGAIHLSVLVSALLMGPMILEWVGEYGFDTRHRPRRLVLFSVTAGFGWGTLFARFLENTRDLAYWSLSAGIGLFCVTVALLGRRYGIFSKRGAD